MSEPLPTTGSYLHGLACGFINQMHSKLYFSEKTKGNEKTRAREFQNKKEDFIEEKSQDTSGNQSTAEGTL